MPLTRQREGEIEENAFQYYDYCYFYFNPIDIFTPQYTLHLLLLLLFILLLRQTNMKQAQKGFIKVANGISN